MSSMLLTALQTPTTVTSGVLPVGSAVHGYGKGVRMNGNAYAIREAGYYSIDSSASIAVTGTDAVTVALYADGVAVPGASASATPPATGDVVNLSLPWVYKKGCCCDASLLTLVVTGTGTLNSLIVRVNKI